MVPAVALADEAVEPQEDATLELLAVGAADFTNATFTLKDGDKTITATKGSLSGTTQAYETAAIANDGQAHKLAVETLTIESTALVADKDYKVEYYTDNNGTITTTEAEDFTNVYWVSIIGLKNTDDGGVDYSTYRINIKVAIAPATISASDVVVFESANGTYQAGEEKDTTFTYTSVQLFPIVRIGTTNLSSSNATITYTKDGVGAVEDTAIKDAGTYHVKYTLTAAVGDYKVGAKGEATFVVEPFDLSRFSIPDGIVGESGEYDTWANVFSKHLLYDSAAFSTAAIKNVLKIEGTGDLSAAGPQTAAISVDAAAAESAGIAASNFKGSPVTVTFNLVNNKTIAVTSNITTVTSGTTTTTKTTWSGTKQVINITNGDAIDLSTIEVKGGADGNTAALSNWTLTATDRDGKVYTGATEVADALKKVGEYTLKVAMNPSAADNYAQGGEMTQVVEITRSEVDADKQVYITFDGRTPTAAGFGATYDGTTDWLKKVNVTVYADENKRTKLVEGTDYTVKVTKNSQEVTEAINSGTYTVAVDGTVGGITFKSGSTASVDLEVAKIQPEKIRLAGLRDAADGTKYYQYTGSAITPVIEYAVTKDGKDVWAILPAENYTLTYKVDDETTAAPTTAAKEVKEKGFYEIKIAEKNPAKDDNYDVNTKIVAGDGVLLYSVAKDGVDFDGATSATDNVGAKTNAAAGGTIYVEVKDGSSFVDVATSDWYYDVVEQANDLKYMTGVGKNIFDPNGTVTRAQAATIIFKMAGNTLDEEGSESYQGGYPTQFADVEAGMWYAQPIQWANRLGIVTGYDATTFGPNDPVSREQFAIMLQRYAKSISKDSAGDASVLASYADASAVDTWATDGVSWAVKNKVMGQNTTVLNPKGKIVRAEAAAMAVRYQPKALK